MIWEIRGANELSATARAGILTTRFCLAIDLRDVKDVEGRRGDANFIEHGPRPWKCRVPVGSQLGVNLTSQVFRRRHDLLKRRTLGVQILVIKRAEHLLLDQPVECGGIDSSAGARSEGAARADLRFVVMAGGIGGISLAR